MSVNEKMTAIADAIRDKTDGTEALTLENMASGVNEVFDAGKKSEYDSFWDKFQINGGRLQYNYAFGGIGWTMDTFKPKYDIRANNLGSMFYQTGITDLEMALYNAGVRLDTSGASNFPSTFYYSDLTVIPELDCRGCANTASPFGLTFRFSSNLLTIRKLILPSNGAQQFNNTFTDCAKLQNIVIEGVIGQNISFSSCPLTVESMRSIITHLKDYSGTTNEFANTVTFKKDCITSLEAEGATSPNGNKWTEYIDDLKWNLVSA